MYYPYGIRDTQDVAPVHYCKFCYGEIYEGDDCYDFTDFGLGHICKSCMDDMLEVAEVPCDPCTPEY